MRKFELKTQLIVMTSLMAVVTASAVLSGCGQRAKLRAAAPGQTVEQKDSTTKKADAPKSDATDPTDLAKEKPAIEVEDPGTVAVAPSGPAAEPSKEEDGVRLFGEPGIELLTRLEKARFRSTTLLPMVDDSHLRLDKDAQSALDAAKQAPFVSFNASANEAYCDLFRTDLRAQKMLNSMQMCEGGFNLEPLTKDYAETHDITDANVAPCKQLRELAKFYRVGWNGTKNLLIALENSSSEFKTISKSYQENKIAELATDAKISKDNVSLYVKAEEAHKQNYEAATVIVELAKIIQCELR